MMAIVVEDAEPVLDDLGIGRIEIDHVAVAGVEAAIGDLVVDAAHVSLRQLIRGAQATPAVGAIHEFVAEREAQLRMRSQVGDARDPQARRAFRLHAERVAVVEPQVRAHADAARGERAGERIVGHAAEDLLRQRAGVFGVDVDLTGGQRAEHDLRAAERAPVDHGRAVALRERGGDLAEDHRFGEGLGADAEARRRGGGGGGLGTGGGGLGTGASGDEDGDEDEDEPEREDGWFPVPSPRLRGEG